MEEPGNGTNAPALPLTGRFINLDRATGRRDRLQEEFARFGFTGVYDRFPAVDGQTIPRRGKLTRGDLGIFRSHIDILKTAGKADQFRHVIEDDVLFSEFTAPVLAYGLSRNLFRDLDIVFLDIAPRPDLGTIKSLKTISDKAFAKPRSELAPSDFRIVDVARLNYYGAASYLVNPRSVGRLVSLYEAEWNAGPRMAVDFFLRQEIAAGRLRGGCVLPFVTTVELEETVRTQSGRSDSATTPYAFGLLRQSFYAGRDLDRLSALADAFIVEAAGEAPDAHYEYIYKLFRFFLFDKM
jgi:GR25 family glycosyltransferase involved in LPS biosynthesis